MNLRKKLWFDRHRIILALLAVLLLAVSHPGLSDPGAGAERYMLVAGYGLASLVILLLSLWMPMLRYLLDGLWLLALTEALLAMGLTAIGLEPAFWIVILVFCAVFAVLFMPLADALLPARETTFTASCLSRMGKAALWPWLAPTPECNRDGKSRRLAEFTWIEPGLRYSYVSLKPYRVTLFATIIAERRPDCLIVTWTAEEERAGAILNPEGRISTVFTTAGEGCLVTQEICQKANPRMRFLLWLDDSYNRLLAEGVAEAEAFQESS